MRRESGIPLLRDLKLSDCVWYLYTYCTIQKMKFHSYFDTLRRRNEYLDCKARCSGKPWKVLVSAVVERLPVVMRDVP
eukprot:9487340-Ditylum_brightwellii.AAC.1